MMQHIRKCSISLKHLLSRVSSKQWRRHGGCVSALLQAGPLSPSTGLGLRSALAVAPAPPHTGLRVLAACRRFNSKPPRCCSRCCRASGLWQLPCHACGQPQPRHTGARRPGLSSSRVPSPADERVGLFVTATLPVAGSGKRLLPLRTGCSRACPPASTLQPSPCKALSPAPELTAPSHLFRTVLLRRLRLPLPVTENTCQCNLLGPLGGCRAACSTSEVLRRRGWLQHPPGWPQPGRRLPRRPSWGGAQLAVDTTLVSPLDSAGLAGVVGALVARRSLKPACGSTPTRSSLSSPLRPEAGGVRKLRPSSAWGPPSLPLRHGCRVCCSLVGVPGLCSSAVLRRVSPRGSRQRWPV